MKDFLTMAELSPASLSEVIDLSGRLKAGRSKGLGSDSLRGKTVVMIFEKPSTRTRVSFQVAVSELGGNPISLSSSELQLGRGETIEDTATVLSRYAHLIMARVNEHSSLVRLSKSADIPVINGLSDLYHPVQILADMLTLKEKKQVLAGLKIGWVGDGDNVCNSWAIGAAMAGMQFVAATPPAYRPMDAAMAKATQIAERTGGSVTVTSDPDVAAADADCVMTDTFVSMGMESEKAARIKAFFPKYRVDSKLMMLAKKDAIFQHCLPAHRGEEVTDEVIDGPQSVVFDEAENRLHTTKALLCYLLLPENELP